MQLKSASRPGCYLEEGIVLHNPRWLRVHAVRYGQDPGVACRAYAGVTLGWLGYPDQALQRSHEALTLAQEVAHPFSRGYALFIATWRATGPRCFGHMVWPCWRACG